MARVRVFMACSLDGFIAGPNDEIDWLQPQEGAEDTFAPFMAQVGAMLMGRRTYEVVNAMDHPWPYGETPVLVATSTALEPEQTTVRSVAGSISETVDEARRAAGDRDVYLDGGRLVRSALDAGLVDEMTLTLVPIVLGTGISLFGGVARRHRLELVGQRAIGAGLVEVTYRPER